MAVIKPKRSGTASSTPTTSDLADGEFAVNSADQKIYIRSGTSVVEVGNVFSATEAETLTNKTVFGKLSGISNQGATKTITVTVATKTANHPNSGGSSSAYFLDGVEAPLLKLTKGTYKFDQADSSNSSHPLRFYLDDAKGTAYTTGVTTNGTAGSSGAYTQIVVDDTTPFTLSYQCSSHAFMGSYVHVSGTTTILGQTIDSDSNTITNIVNADIKSNAAIALSKLATTTASRALVSSGTGAISASDVTSTELSLLDGSSAGSVVNSKAVIYSGTGTIAGTLSTAAQTNITSVGALDGGSITSGFGSINNGSSAITTTGLISGGSLDIDDVVIDGSTIGHTDDTDLMTVADGVVTVAGELSATTLDIGGTNITATAAEINLIDGGTARGTTAVASGDGVLINDAGTMRMTNVDTLSTYFDSISVGGSNIVTTGALDSGSITSGFGTIDTGSSTITTTGNITGGTLTSTGNVVIANGGNIGSASDTDAITIDSSGNVTISQNLTVSGTTTTQDSQTLTVSANLIEVNTGLTGTNSNDSGLVVERGSTGDNAIIAWDESEDKFIVGTTTATSTSTGNLTITTGTLVANLEGNVTGTLQTAAQTNITSVGALDGGSITSGFGTIDTGSSTITTTGNITGGTLTSTGNIVVSDGGNIGSASDTDAIAIASGGAVTFSQNPVFPTGGVNIASLDIDGAGSSVTTLADADLFIVDDGGGGTNKKVTASVIKAYTGGGITVKEETSTLSTAATTLKFVGDSVTATGSGVEKTITITDDSLINAIIFG